MELRLLLDGGVPPGAPPGKIEPSSGEFQFEVELSTEAQKLAIVEEMGCEPNVPPTNLDPESEQEETLLPETPVSNSPLSIMMGHLILGRPEPSRIQNSVPNRQIAAARIDGDLTVELSSPSGNRDVNRQLPITVLPDAELLQKFEGWATQFRTRQTAIEQDAAPTATLGSNMEQQFNPEHLEALNVVFMSKRQIVSDQPVIANAVVQSLSQSVETRPATALKAATQVQNSMPQTPQLAVVVPASTHLRVAEPKLAQQSEQPAEAAIVTETATSNVVATAKQSTGSNLTGDDESQNQETIEDQSGAEVPTSSSTRHPSLADKAVVSPAVNQSSDRAPMSLEDRQRNIDVITRKIESLAVNSVRNEVRVEMYPPDMGSVSINVKQAIDSLSVTLTASNDQVQEALHESRNDLAASLQVKAKQEVTIEIKAGQAQSLPQEQANAHHQRNPQREQPEARQPLFSAPEREQKQPTPQAQRVRPNTFINLEI